MKIKALSILALSFILGCGGGEGSNNNNLGPIISTSSLRGTGFDSNANLLSIGGQKDGSWSVIKDGQLSTGPVLLTSAGPNWSVNWLDNSAKSQWIGASNVSNPGTAPYSFEIVFFIDSFDPDLTEFVGRWAIDDDGEIAVNGTVVDTLDAAKIDASPNWTQLNPFIIPAGSGILRRGQNRITITITQTDNFLEGIRFEGELNVRQ